MFSQTGPHIHSSPESSTNDMIMLVVLNETWVNAHHGQDTLWIGPDGKVGWKYPSGKGGCLIVLHAGTADHFKEYVRKNNKEFTMVKIQQLTPTSTATVTHELWKKYIEHIRKDTGSRID